MYNREKTFFEDTIEVEEKHSGRYGAPGQKRQKKKNPTPEQIKKQNQRNKAKRIRHYLKANFRQYDYYPTLTYRRDKRPTDYEAAQKELRKFIERLRRQYKKMEQELKWIAVTEIGKKGAVHHHIVINRIPDGDILIRKCWNKGMAYLQSLKEEGTFGQLADYIAKSPEEDNLLDKRYSRSRNLVEPRREKKVMKRPTWGEKIMPPKGFYVDKSSIVEGLNPVTGFLYRYYTLVKVKKRLASSIY